MILIHDEDGDFYAEIPEPERFDVVDRAATFRADRYDWGHRSDSWRVSGIARNKDGSLHKGGRREGTYVNHADVPESIRMQAQAFYNDLADRLAGQYRQAGLEALSEDNITYDDLIDGDDADEPRHEPLQRIG